ncbi:MAG: hypothetical protein II918_00055 [Firmicutes bacterium]|jgi:hypothetical protein|nr:hypothetical protein [Bacillota bacterium]MCR4710232.1 hypothetical protein [Clostridiales bacterium]
MKQGRTMVPTEVSPKNVGKALMSLIGLGLASGVALVAGTNMIMSKLFPEQTETEEEEEE